MRFYDKIFPSRERVVALAYDLIVAASAIAVLVTQAHWGALVALATVSLPAPFLFNSVFVKRKRELSNPLLAPTSILLDLLGVLLAALLALRSPALAATAAVTLFVPRLLLRPLVSTRQSSLLTKRRQRLLARKL